MEIFQLKNSFIAEKEKFITKGKNTMLAKK